MPFPEALPKLSLIQKWTGEPVYGIVEGALDETEFLKETAL